MIYLFFNIRQCRSSQTRPNLNFSRIICVHLSLMWSQSQSTHIYRLLTVYETLLCIGVTAVSKLDMCYASSCLFFYIVLFVRNHKPPHRVEREPLWSSAQKQHVTPKIKKVTSFYHKEKSSHFPLCSVFWRGDGSLCKSLSLFLFIHNTDHKAKQQTRDKELKPQQEQQKSQESPSPV